MCLYEHEGKERFERSLTPLFYFSRVFSPRVLLWYGYLDMKEHQQIVDELTRYFESRTDVVWAFLFGSRVKKFSRSSSDWDIGIYLTEENKDVEERIRSDTERITGAETDVVVLNRAPASIAWSILRTGAPLVIKDRGRYLDFMLRVSNEAESWRRTAAEYHEIFERSASLTEEDKRRLERIVQFLEQEAPDYDKFRSLEWKEYERDRAKKREVERWAEQIVNAVIDIAKIVLASERRVIPETYRMIVQALGTVVPFDQDNVCAKLSRWTELRNVLAHEYLDYRWREIESFIKETKPLILAFVGRIKGMFVR